MSPRQLDTTVVPFEAGDARPLDLLHVTGRHAPVRGPVLLVHGAGVRADIFRAPVATTIVDALVERGWDVWLENWRASIDLQPCRWTLDQAAVHDHPRAVRKVLDLTGADTLQAVVHCHENLNDETHEWLTHEFAAVPFTFFAQMARCVEQGHLVSVDGLPELPESFVAQAPKTDARFVFVAGLDNRCFLAESQRRTFRFFDSLQPRRHALHLLHGYGHLDVFMGRRAARDVFPMILEELQC